MSQNSHSRHLTSKTRSLLLRLYLPTTAMVVLFTLLILYHAKILPQLTSPSPLDQPNISTTAVLVWANEAAVRLNTLNYLTYRRDLKQIHTYFTPTGWSRYKKALEKTQYLNQINQKKMLLSAVATDVPMLLDEGIIDKHYTWLIQIPLLIHFQNNAHLVKKHRLIQLVITRTPSYWGKRGIGILSFQEYPLSSTPPLASVGHFMPPQAGLNHRQLAG